MIEMHLPLAGPLPNWTYGVTNAAALNPTNGILMVARLDGPTASIAQGLVDKALQAERDGLWGRAYFDARGLTQSDTNRVICWATNGFLVRRKLPARWDSKPSWTTSPNFSPRIFP